MAAYQHWTSSLPLRHPWFDAQTTKRKHLDDAVDGTETDVRSTKKPRCSVLERGFANLSLDNAALTNDNDAGYSTMEDITFPLNVLRPSPDLQPLQIIRPSSIEEPCIPDVKMESSWCEPEPDRAFTECHHDSLLIAPPRYNCHRLGRFHGGRRRGGQPEKRRGAGRSTVITYLH